MSKLFKLIPYEKWRFALSIVKHNGGIIKSLEKLWRMDTLKIGTYKGTDSFGNKYFENPYYMVGRSRWVEYNPAVKWNYDASQVTPEWFGWLHYKTDKVPEADCPRVNLMNDSCARKWLLPHDENLTCTNRAYYPYSTTKPHIQLWDGLFLYYTPLQSIYLNKGAISAIDVDATLKILFSRNEMEELLFSTSKRLSFCREFQ